MYVEKNLNLQLAQTLRELAINFTLRTDQFFKILLHKNVSTICQDSTDIAFNNANLKYRCISPLIHIFFILYLDI